MDTGFKVEQEQLATRDESEIWIFYANDLKEEPLCKLSHPLLDFAYTLHTTWLPKMAPCTASYNCYVREDYEYLVKKKSRDIQHLFDHEIYRRFEDKQD